MALIYSTLSSDNHYHQYVPVDRESAKKTSAPNIIKKTVIIKGGSGIANPKTRVTTLGRCTEVSDEELEFLKSDEVFQTHLKNGFVRINEQRVDPEVAAADMELRDESAPVLPEDNLQGDVNVANSENIKSAKGKKDRSYSVRNNLQ